MPFKYTPSNPERIVFSRLDAGCGRFMFIAIGGVFTVIGVGLVLFGSGIEMPFALIRFIVPLFGIGAIYVGVILPKLQSKSTPDEIVFDNKNGRVEINQKVSEIQTAFIYYDEIDTFIVKPKKHESSSSGSTRSSRSYYTFHVYLTKKDGGQWELLSFNNEAAAFAEVEKLKMVINLAQAPQRSLLSVNDTKKFTITSDHQSSELSWRNPLGYGPIALFLFSALFLTIFYIIISSGFVDDDFPIFAYIVIGFIAVVFCIVIGGNIIKMIKNAFTTYAVKITNDRLEYMERDNAGRIKKSTIFPVANIHAISFSFDTDNTLRKIFIYTHQQFNQQKEMKVGFSLDYIKAMYNFYASLVALDLQDLTAVEALYVENYLQQQLKERSNTTVA